MDRNRTDNFRGFPCRNRRIDSRIDSRRIKRINRRINSRIALKNG